MRSFVFVLSIAILGCGSDSDNKLPVGLVDAATGSGNPGDGAVIDAPAIDAGHTDVGAADVGPADARADAPADASRADVGAPDVGPACIDAGAATDAGCLAVIPVFSTGVDSTGVSLAGGVVDPHYTLIQSADTMFTGPDAIVVSQIAEGYWLPQSAVSKWIAPSANQAYPGPVPCNAAGTYVYRTTFNLTGYDPATAKIDGGWAADNAGTGVRLNGVSLGITAGGYNPLTPFTIASGFVAGTNTLEFEILDSGCPNGLRVELAGTAAVGR